jgi:hypothetical protein
VHQRGPGVSMASAVPPHFGIAVDLVAHGAQAVDTVPIDIPFPGPELIDRQVVELAYLFYGNPGAAHGLDNSRLAAHRPPLPRPRQLWHQSERVCTC